MRRYLKEFLSDRGVIDNAPVVVRAQSGDSGPFGRRAAAATTTRSATVRTGTNYKTINRSQAEKLVAAFADRRIAVDWAMAYGNPSTLPLRLSPREAGRRSDRSALSAIRGGDGERVRQGFRGTRPDPPATDAALCAALFATAAYIEADPPRLRRNSASFPGSRRSCRSASFHGIPKEYVQKGDPYESQCVETARLLRSA